MRCALNWVWCFIVDFLCFVWWLLLCWFDFGIGLPLATVVFYWFRNLFYLILIIAYLLFNLLRWLLVVLLVDCLNSGWFDWLVDVCFVIVGCLLLVLLGWGIWGFCLFCFGVYFEFLCFCWCGTVWFEFSATLFAWCCVVLVIIICCYVIVILLNWLVLNLVLIQFAVSFVVCLFILGDLNAL